MKMKVLLDLILPLELNQESLIVHKAKKNLRMEKHSSFKSSIKRKESDSDFSRKISLSPDALIPEFDEYLSAVPNGNIFLKMD